MKEFKQFMLLLVVLLLGSCSNDLMESVNQSSGTSGATTRVDMQTALDRAERMLAKIEGGKTRSRRVASIRYLNIDGKTRAEGSLDSLYYIINYADNGGFAVAGADTRLDGIYAISEEGHLEESDVEENPGLQYFFDMLPDEECLDMLGKPGIGTGSGPGMGMDTTLLVLPPIQFTDIDLSEKIGPYIHPNVSHWHQEDPFNNECPVKNGIRCHAGCVPVATAIIMSYYEWPNSYGNNVYDWQAMKNATLANGQIIATYIPNLIRHLGAGNNYDTNYNSVNDKGEIIGSSSDTKAHYKRTFRHFGYQEPKDFKDFDNNALQAFLKDSHGPVLVRGNRDKDGHAWVIDGYYLDSHVGTAYVGGRGGDGLMFHVIWGWGGNRNGYFKFGGSIESVYKYNDSNDDWRWKHYYLYDKEAYKEYLAFIQFKKMEYVGGFVPNK